MSQDFLQTILKQKEAEVAQLVNEPVESVRSTYSLFDFLTKQKGQLQLITEVKKASPSMGEINLTVDITEQASQYEAAGAAMISVLTDQIFFKGDVQFLRQISDLVSIPTLAKDFIIDEKQIIRSLNAGATVILLIVAALSEDRLKELFKFATRLGLEVLVETHNLSELDIAHRIGAKIIGVNNRNLTTFEVSLQTSHDLAPHFLPDRVYVSESGIFTNEQAELLAPYFHALLVGTALMQSEDVAQKVKELSIEKG